MNTLGLEMKSFTTHGLRIVLIAAVALLALRGLLLVIKRVERLAEKDEAAREEIAKRARTLYQVLRTAVFIIILTIAGIMVIKELGIDIGPILAGAGVLGLAIGLGAQALIRDLIGGVLILVENQFRVGDVVRAGGVSGRVEHMSLRTTVLRDLEGAVHVVPNSEIKVLSNLTKEWSQAVVSVNVSYDENVDDVIKALGEISEGLYRDEKFSSIILEKPQVLGLDEFGESSLSMKVLIKTAPMKQREVARELRRRIKNSFDERKFEAPHPRRIVITKTGEEQ